MAAETAGRRPEDVGDPASWAGSCEEATPKQRHWCGDWRDCAGRNRCRGVLEGVADDRLDLSNEQLRFSGLLVYQCTIFTECLPPKSERGLTFVICSPSSMCVWFKHVTCSFELHTHTHRHTYAYRHHVSFRRHQLYILLRHTSNISKPFNQTQVNTLQPVDTH